MLITVTGICDKPMLILISTAYVNGAYWETGTLVTGCSGLTGRAQVSHAESSQANGVQH